MVEFSELVVKLAVPAFVVTCMVAAGLGVTVRGIVAPFRRARLLLSALALNFVVAPVLALGFCEAISLDRPFATGLILLGSAAGAPFLPKLAGLAQGDIAFAIGLMLLQTIGTVVLLPITLPLMIPGQSVEAWPILRPLAITMLLPLGIGIAIRRYKEGWALRLRPAFTLASNVFMIIAVALLVGLNVSAMSATFGSGAATGAAVFVFVLTVAGHTVGGPSMQTRSVLGLGTGQRNIAAALIVATQNAMDSQVIAMLLISTLVGLIVLLPMAKWFAQQGPGSSDVLLTEEAIR